MSKIIHRTLIPLLIAVVAMIGLGITTIFNTATADAATTVTYKVTSVTETKTSKGLRHVPVFTCNGMKGLCQEAKKSMPKKGVTLKGKRTELAYNDDRAMLAYYYGYKKGWTKNSNGLKLSRAFSYAGGHGTEAVSTSTLKSMIKTARAQTNNGAVYKGLFHAYSVKANNGSQGFICWKMNSYPSLNLIKESSDSNYKKSFEGCEYTVYTDSACTKSTGKKLTCAATGISNKITSLLPGTYYVKETKTNANYKLNPKVYTVTLVAEKGVTVKAKDDPAVTEATIEKIVTGNEIKEDVFTFILKNNDTKETYRLSVSTGKDGKGSNRMTVLPGNYTVTEDLSASQLAYYEDKTGTQQVTIKPGTNNVIKRENFHEKSNPRMIINKTVDDGSSPAGFQFEIEGICYDSQGLTERQVLAAGNPAIKEVNNAYTAGEWKITDKGKTSLEKLNSDVPKPENSGKSYTIEAECKASYSNIGSLNTESYYLNADGTKYNIPSGEVFICNEKIYEALSDYRKTTLTEEDLSNPADFREIPKEISYKADIKILIKKLNEDQLESDTEEQEQNGATWNNFTWNGVATTFYKKDEKTVTDIRGRINIEVKPGKYTVREILTDEQKKLYECDNIEQTAEILDKEEQLVSMLNFENKVKKTPVKLLKENEKTGKPMSDISFTITGTTITGNNVSITKITNENGLIEFGELMPGNYVVVENTFDSKDYRNVYPYKNYKMPAIAFTVTGNEKSDLWIGGPERNGSASTEKQVFINSPQTKLYITKVDADSNAFLSGAEFDLKDSTGESAAKFAVLEDTSTGGVKIDLMESYIGIEAINGTLEDGTDVDEEVGSGTDEEGTEDGDEGIEDGDEDLGDEEGDDTGDDDFNYVPDDEDTEDGEEGKEEPAENVVYKYGIISGLKEGEKYTLYETKAPEGYSPCAPQEVVIEPDEEGIFRLVVVNEIPKIGTTALDKDTGLHMSNADDEITIVDTVSYEGLTPGAEYTMVGKLIDKDAINEEDPSSPVEFMVNDKPVESSVKFTPETATGTVDVTFTFDGSEFGGRSIVVFEKLLQGDYEITNHYDIDDEDQSIYIPKIGTTAADAETGLNISNADKEVTIVDTVAYENLIPDRVYKVTGTLMDKKTGKPIMVDGKPVTAENEFKPEESEGTISVTFKFDGSALAGTTAVAFEELTAEEKIVGEHKDIEDEDQTVLIPSIGTKATLKTKKIVDVVKYENLIPGHKYIMRGQLIDKASGEEIKDATAEKVFEPEKESGTIDLEFNIDTKTYAGKDIVVFEKAYIEIEPADKDDAVNETEPGNEEVDEPAGPDNDEEINEDEAGEDTEEVIPDETREELIASHEDINDKNQTVSIPKTPQTGQNIPWILLILGGGLIGSGIYVFRNRKSIFSK